MNDKNIDLNEHTDEEADKDKKMSTRRAPKGPC